MNKHGSTRDDHLSIGLDSADLSMELASKSGANNASDYDLPVIQLQKFVHDENCTLRTKEDLTGNSARNYNNHSSSRTKVHKLIMKDLVRGDYVDSRTHNGNAITGGTSDRHFILPYTASLDGKKSSKTSKLQILHSSSKSSKKTSKKDKMKTSNLELVKNTTPKILKVPG